MSRRSFAMAHPPQAPAPAWHGVGGYEIRVFLNSLSELQALRERAFSAPALGRKEKGLSLGRLFA